MIKKSKPAETVKMVDKSLEARKAREADARNELSRMKARMRKLNLAEIEMMAYWCAYSNLGFGGDFYQIHGDDVYIEIHDCMPDQNASLRAPSSVMHIFAGRMQNMAESDKMYCDMMKEVQSWRRQFSGPRGYSLDKIATTWPDMAPVVLWLAKNGGQG